MRCCATMLLCLAALPASTARADPGVVTLADGRKLHGEVRETEDGVELLAGGKTQRFARDDVKRLRYDAEIEADYSRRSAAAGADDLAAQMELLRWCHAEGAPDLIVRQAQRVLRLRPDDADARDLMKRASLALAEEQRHLREAERDAGRESGRRTVPRRGRGGEAQQEGQRKLTREEINRLRFMELAAIRRQQIVRDAVRVSIPPEVQNDFLSRMAGQPSFEGPEGKRRFRTLPPDLMLAELAYYTVDPAEQLRLADRVEVRTDPEVFQTFKTQVLPRVVSTCATSRCHGSPGDERTNWRLFDSRGRPPEEVYANFLLLDEFETDHRGPQGSQRFRMLDRGRPDESLLLAWMLPPDRTPVPVHHPGEAKFKPPFTSVDHPAYQAIRSWIETLRLPRPNYGVYLTRPAPAASAPAGEEPPADADS